MSFGRKPGLAAAPAVEKVAERVAGERVPGRLVLIRQRSDMPTQRYRSDTIQMGSSNNPRIHRHM